METEYNAEPLKNETYESVMLRLANATNYVLSVQGILFWWNVALSVANLVILAKLFL